MQKLKLEKPLENRRGVLYFGGCNTLELAKRFDTPLYVIDEDRVRENYRRMFNAMKKHYPRVRVHYAAKANTNLEVLRILRREGAYLDVVSPGEVFLALKAGFNPKKMLFTGTSVREDELRYLLKRRVTINIDALSEFDDLLEIKVPEVLSVRVNPEIGITGGHRFTITAGKYAKFGLWEDDALKAYEAAKDAGVKRFGVHMHIGSGGLMEKFLPAFKNLLKTAGRARRELDIKFDFVDMGGGFFVPYKPEEKSMDLNRFFSKMLGLFKEKISEYDLGNPFFCCEPGRYIVADASILLTRVNTVKETPYKKFVGVDAGENTLIRPAFYDAYHHILVANKSNAPPAEKYDVVGPICNSGDCLAHNRMLPKIEEGDLLAVLNAGAYGYTMSSHYNMRPKAAEVLVKKSRVKLVRERETFADLLKHQR